MSNAHLAFQFFVQLAVILIFCRVLGVVFGWLGQPQVVAEMIGGVLLGPSLFGLLWPQAQHWLFPWDSAQHIRDTQSYLYPVSQLGLALYMFTVGAEFHLDIVKRTMRSAVAVSIAGMLAPFVLGAGLAWFLFARTTMFTSKTGLAEAMLFLGASMCITAFPMLARIIQHKKLGGTTMGTVALGAGAINDAAAWCLLAIVLASFEHNWNQAWLNIAAAAGYVAVVAAVIRPLLRTIEHWMVMEERLTDAGLIITLVLMLAGAWFTDLIGLHAVLGAFVMGAAMPRGIVARDIINRVQPLTIALLLPLYFTFSGLQTKIGLLNSGFLWLICGAILAAAIIGKGAACWLAARATGMPNRQALSIGTLMNTRGLMELIIINIGLQRGIISEGLFACLVIMAVVTTFMACPLFDWIGADYGEFPATRADDQRELQRKLVA